MDKLDFKKIKLLIMDVDGVLTDGGFYVSNSGDISRKFNVLDGFGIREAIKKGIELAIITGGKSDAIIHRSDYLGVKHVFMGREDKLSVYLESIQPVLKVKDEEVAFIGDDVYDIPLMEKIGISVTVPNAHEKVKKAAKYITSQRGGEGAVREVIDLILGT
jgi:3-deoxy-D-manno-octulosonate 8-phosphate phosphatase (KDO 8-P phosphatase)